jgi:putative tricarboxylic transport membrane protein
MIMNTLRKYKEVLTGAFLLAFSAFFFYNAGSIRLLGKQIITARAFPRTLAVLLGFLSLWMLVEGCMKLAKNSSPRAAASGTPKDYSGAARIGLTIIALIVYILCMRPVGFLLSTIAYTFVQTLILTPRENRDYRMAVITSIVLPTIIYGIFFYGLRLMLPQGILAF